MKYLLAVDIGNTHTTLGAYDGAALRHTWRLQSHLRRTADEWGVDLLQLLGAWRLGPDDLQGVIIASVVPPMDGPWQEAVARYLHLKPFFVTATTRLGIRNLYKNPEEVGADRLVNAVAVHQLIGKTAIVVDFGTATTFDCVTSKGDYLGGVIAPGLEIANEALASRTAKLPRVTFEIPQRALGKTTKESLQSGLFWGYIGLVEGILKRLIKEMKTSESKSPLLIATGGLSTIIGPRLTPPARVMPHLTLDGLRLIWGTNKEAI